jgi:sugar phosphate isomerase/epimerase
MKIVISALHFEWQDIRHCLRRVKEEFGLDGVEFSWTQAFRHPHSTREDLAALRELKGTADVVLSAHVWENLAGVSPAEAGAALLSWLQIAGQTGVRDLIVHGGSYPDRKEGIVRTRRVLESVLPRFERAGVVLDLENHYAFDYRDCRELFSEPWEFKEVFSLGSPALGFCFDSGHAHMTRNWQPLVEQLAPWLRYVHLADNLGEFDDHLMFREGTVPWDGIFDGLTRTGFDGVFCVEFPVRDCLDPFRTCLSELRERFGS